MMQGFLSFLPHFPLCFIFLYSFLFFILYVSFNTFLFVFLISVLLPLSVHGQWAEWSEWSECDAECGGGLKIRSRSCSNPPPKNGGKECEGMTMQTQSCNTHRCGTGTDSHTGV